MAGGERGGEMWGQGEERQRQKHTQNKDIFWCRDNLGTLATQGVLLWRSSQPSPPQRHHPTQQKHTTSSIPRESTATRKWYLPLFVPEFQVPYPTKSKKDNYILQYNESLIQEQTKTILPVSDWMQKTEPALNRGAWGLMEPQMIQATRCLGTPPSVDLTICYARSLPFKTLSFEESDSYTSMRRQNEKVTPRLAKHQLEEKESDSRASHGFCCVRSSAPSPHVRSSHVTQIAQQSHVDGVEKLTTLILQMSALTGRATEPLNYERVVPEHISRGKDKT